MCSNVASELCTRTYEYARTWQEGDIRSQLELLPELKLKPLHIIARLTIQRLRNADFKRSHGRNPHDSDARGITQALLPGLYATRPPDGPSIDECAQAH